MISEEALWGMGMRSVRWSLESLILFRPFCVFLNTSSLKVRFAQWSEKQLRHPGWWIITTTPLPYSCPFSFFKDQDILSNPGSQIRPISGWVPKSGPGGWLGLSWAILSLLTPLS
jgi:hypothetical protein